LAVGYQPANTLAISCCGIPLPSRNDVAVAASIVNNHAGRSWADRLVLPGTGTTISTLPTVSFYR
jgi:imidazoleglycerol phosphate synthase glutamine amidotransferase subunit HisH